MSNIGAADYWLEAFKSFLSLIGPLLGLLVTVLVLNQLSTKWTIHQKKKEMVISTLNDLYKLYGEIVSIVKLYRKLEFYDDTIYKEAKDKKEIMKKIVEETYNIEGKWEANPVKIASEKELNDTELEILGRFRQAYQSIREHIERDEKVPWSRSDESEYLTFKRLTYLVARIIQSSMHVKFSWRNILTPEYESYTQKNKDALRIITANYWEEREHGWRIQSKEDWENLCNFESPKIAESVKDNITNIKNKPIKYESDKAFAREKVLGNKD